MDELIELMLKEQDVARELYKEQRAIQDTYTKLFAGVIVTLLTFIIKGDLPEQAYLLVAVVQVIGSIYVLYIAYRKRCCAGVYLISEGKLAKLLNTKYPGMNLFNIGPLRRQLRDEDPKKVKTSKYISPIVVGFFVASYLFFVHRGLMALSLSFRVYFVYFIGAILIPSVFAILSYYQNQQQKRRSAEAIKVQGLNIATQQVLTQIEQQN